MSGILADAIPAALNRGSGWPWTQASSIASAPSRDAGLPLISVVTPSFNQGPYLEATLRSVLLQGYPSLEFIVIDGGSTDNSVEVIRHYASHLSYWVSERDRGQSHAINKGFLRARGELLCWLNSDDQYFPGALRAAAEAFRNYPEAGAFVGTSERVDSKGRRLLLADPPGLSHGEILRWRTRHLAQPACFFRRSVWEDIGPLDESLHFQMDYDLWLRMSARFQLQPLPFLLARELRHPAAKTIAFAAESRVERWLVKLRFAPKAAQEEMVEEVRELLRIQRRAQALSRLPLARLTRRLSRLILRSLERLG